MSSTTPNSTLERTALGGADQQEVDLPAAFKDVCGAYAQLCVAPQQQPNVLDRAIQVALAERPTAVIVPADVSALEYQPPEHARKNVPSSLGAAPVYHRAGARRGLRCTAEILNAGERVAILAGHGASGCAAELSTVADLLGAGWPRCYRSSRPPKRFRMWTTPSSRASSA
uniref:hypothetical protein n=1 Tax=Nocardia donostiensis TaxID=1538463 RepID=UPI0009DB417F